MGPIWYRVGSEFRSHGTRAAATAVVVALVGGLVLTLTAGVLRTLSAPERYSATLGDTYDVSLEQQSGRPRTDEVGALSGVAAIDTATFVFGGVIGNEDSEIIEGFVFAGSHRAFGARVADGREPDPAAPGEFVATRSWLSEAGAQLGDQFQVLTITQDQADELGFDVPAPEGPTLPATLVGVIDGPNELQDETPLALFGEALLDEGDVGVASSVGVVALGPGTTVDDLRAQLDALPNGEVFGLDSVEWVSAEVRAAVGTQGQGVAVVAAIVAVAAIAVTGQLLSRQMRQPEALRLTMSAIGLTRAQMVGDPLCSTALPVAAGSVAAGVLAFAASGVFPVGFVQRVEPSPGLLFEPLVHGLGPILFGVVLLAWVLVALIVGDRENRTPRRHGLVEPLASRLRPASAAIGMRFALTRHPRDPSVRAPIIGLILVLGVLVGALTYGASLGRFIDEPARYGSNFDFATGAGGDTVPEEVSALLDSDPDVADVTLFGTLLASVGSTALDITGMQPARGMLEPDLLAGRLPRSEEEIVLGRVAARQLDVKLEDELVVVGAGGPVSFEITGLAVIPSVEGGDGIGEGGVVTLEGLRRLDPEAQLGVAAIRLRPGATGAAERIGETIGTTVGLPDKPSTVVNLERVRSTPFIVAGSLAALAVLSMSHQLIMSTRRRRRDLAVLRALGAHRRWVTSVLHWQVTLLATTVAALALPLGIVAGRLVYQGTIDRIGARADLSLPYVMLGSMVVALLILGNAAATLPARRVRHERPARILADE
jgi:hypothetical protein